MLKSVKAIFRRRSNVHCSFVNSKEDSRIVRTDHVRLLSVGQRCESEYFDYGGYYQRAAMLEQRYKSHQLKSHECDIYNDLFVQLGMGSANEEYNKPFGIQHFTFYPVPHRTAADYPDYNFVKHYLEDNPEFKYKLRISFFCRLLIGVMDKWYGKYIHYFDKLAEEAFWSVMKQNHSWDSLNLQIKMALEDNLQYVPKGMSPSVDRLCRHTLQTIHHNHILSKEVLSYSIYAYLTNYRPTRMNQIKCDQSIYDGAILHEDGATHSVYLMHIAWTQYLHEGALKVANWDELEVCPRDLLGYSQLLLNFLFFHVSNEQRIQMVTWLKETHQIFLNKNCSNYTHDDYLTFFANLSWGVLRDFPEMDGVMGCGNLIDPSMIDIDKLFFKESKEENIPHH